MCAYVTWESDGMIHAEVTWTNFIFEIVTQKTKYIAIVLISLCKHS